MRGSLRYVNRPTLEFGVNGKQLKIHQKFKTPFTEIPVLLYQHGHILDSTKPSSQSAGS